MVQCSPAARPQPWLAAAKAEVSTLAAKRASETAAVIAVEGDPGAQAPSQTTPEGFVPIAFAEARWKERELEIQ